MKKIFTMAVALVFLITFFVQGQDIATATIQWNADRILNSVTNQWVEDATAIVSYGSRRIEWTNGNGSIRTRFQVIERIGEWTDVSDEGHVQYEVTDGKYSGTITINKERGETKIIIAIASEPPATEELIITSRQVL